MADRIIKSCSKGKKLGFFVSAEQTGTGSEQSIPHGLGQKPDYVAVILTEFGTAQNPDVTYGTHDAANVKVTVASSTVKFIVLAIVYSR